MRNVLDSLFQFLHRKKSWFCELVLLLDGAVSRLAYNWPVPSRTRFPLMPNEQVPNQSVDTFVFFAIQFRIFVK
jgi:hypothetical protein